MKAGEAAMLSLRLQFLELRFRAAHGGGATWQSALRINWSNGSVGFHMKGMSPFFLLPRFLHNPDSLLVTVLPNLPVPGNGLPLSSIFDLVLMTQFSMSFGALNLTIDATK